MQISQILEKKTVAVISLTAEATIAEAANVLTENRIGLVAVCDAGGRLEGVLSERDIVRGLSQKGAALLEMAVAELMTRDLLTCNPNDNSATVLKRMWERNVRHMPVIDGNELVQVLSVRDLMAQIVEDGDARTKAALMEIFREGRYYPGA